MGKKGTKLFVWNVAEKGTKNIMLLLLCLVLGTLNRNIYGRKGMIEKEQKSLKLNSSRNIIWQNRNINCRKGNKNSFIGNDLKKNGLKLNSRRNIALLGKIGTLVVEKGTKTLLLRTLEEQKGLKLNSKRNIIGQIRNIHG